MILEGVAIGAMLIMKCVPETPAARLLHAGFVERPVAWVRSRTRAHLILAIIMIGMAVAGGEFVMLAGPEMAMLVAWDSALTIDAAIAAWTAASLARLRAMRNYVVATLRGARGRNARPRTVRSRVRALKHANDDEPGLATLAA